MVPRMHSDSAITSSVIPQVLHYILINQVWAVIQLLHTPQTIQKAAPRKGNCRIMLKQVTFADTQINAKGLVVISQSQKNELLAYGVPDTASINGPNEGPPQYIIPASDYVDVIAYSYPSADSHPGADSHPIPIDPNLLTFTESQLHTPHWRK